MSPRQTIAEKFIDHSILYLQEDFLPRIEHCVHGLSEEEIWWRPNPSSNSVGNLLLHLEGNVRQWIISGVGKVPDTREREKEFREQGPLARNDLLGSLRRTVEEASTILRRITSEQLLDQRRIQVYEVTVLEAVYHVVEHFSHHTGQILFVTKQLQDKDLGFYRGLQPE